MKTKSAKLSNNLLQMKFMKKTAIETQEEQALKERQHLIDDEHWYLDIDQTEFKSNERVITVEPSFTVFSGIIFGRMSFNGYNAQIEKLNKPEELKPVSEDEKEIEDELLAKHFGPKSKKFARKKHEKHHVKRLGH